MSATDTPVNLNALARLDSGSLDLGDESLVPTTRPRPVSAFAAWEDEVYKHKFRATVQVDTLVGGTPSDPRVAEGWLRTKLGINKEDDIQDLVQKAMVERHGLEADEKTPDQDEVQRLVEEAVVVSNATTNEVEAAIKQVVALKHLNGFKRDRTGLFIEGRQLKAAMKEAANIAWPKDRWGVSKKGTRSYWAEHAFVEETRLYLCTPEGEPLHQPTGINQRFIHTFRGTGIQYEEYVEDATFQATIKSDHDLDPRVWGVMWVTSQQNGIGAARSQGFGTFKVTDWNEIS